MVTENSVKYAATGHEEILASLRKKHRLTVVQTFSSGQTACTLATTPSDEQVFVKIKGYQKNKANAGRFARALTSNRMAAKVRGDVMPRFLELRGFERDGVLWLVMVSTYGGEPMSGGMFFEGDSSTVEDDTLRNIRFALGVIQETPSFSVFYDPGRISGFIKREYGEKAAFAAAEWTSAHCDFHWGNILAGGRQIIDWDMFALAPRGFDAASIVLFSASDTALFDRMRHALSDLLSSDSARVATLFAAARILRLMKTEAFAGLQVHEQNLRRAVDVLLQQ